MPVLDVEWALPLAVACAAVLTPPAVWDRALARLGCDRADTADAALRWLGGAGVALGLALLALAVLVVVGGHDVSMTAPASAGFVIAAGVAEYRDGRHGFVRGQAMAARARIRRSLAGLTRIRVALKLAAALAAGLAPPAIPPRRHRQRGGPAPLCLRAAINPARAPRSPHGPPSPGVAMPARGGHVG